MKKISISILSFMVLIFAGCSRSKFAELNTNPDAVLSIDPATELATGMLSINNNTNENFYDFNLAIRPWTQTFVAMTGNSTSSFTSPGNINQRWGQFYGAVGTNLIDVIHLIDIMPADKKATYQFMRAITGIPLAYYAFYVSDANGYMPYTKAFQARYTTPPNLTPVYDSQESLFDTLDAQLQGIVTVLKSTPSVNQVTPGESDIYYQGNYTNWIKAANSLRLKIAMRLIKRNPSKATSIANDVISDNVGLIDNNSNEWSFQASANFNIGTNNSDPDNNGHLWSGEKLMVDFMWSSQDPRMRNIYLPSAITSKAMFDSAKAQGQIPASMNWDGQLYRGMWATPSASTNQTNSAYFQPLNFSFNGVPQSVRLPSRIQQRMIYAPNAYDPTNPTNSSPGKGSNYFPVITYADVCFMRAELKQRGLSNDPMSVQDLYNNGVTASIVDYDIWAKAAQVWFYKPIGATEISDYLAKPGVAFNASTALEQIYDQAFIDFYLNPNEAWALLKRTGYPNATGSIMQLENLTSNGSVLMMPRRYPVNAPVLGDLNYNNETNAITAQQQDPSFGNPQDITGRVWWDQQ